MRQIYHFSRLLSARPAPNRKEFEKLLSKPRGCSALDREEIMRTSKIVQQAPPDSDVIEFIKKNDLNWPQHVNNCGVSNTRASIVVVAITRTRRLMTTTKWSPLCAMDILK